MQLPNFIFIIFKNEWKGSLLFNEKREQVLLGTTLRYIRYQWFMPRMHCKFSDLERFRGNNKHFFTPGFPLITSITKRKQHIYSKSGGYCSLNWFPLKSYLKGIIAELVSKPMVFSYTESHKVPRNSDLSHSIL